MVTEPSSFSVPFSVSCRQIVPRHSTAVSQASLGMNREASSPPPGSSPVRSLSVPIYGGRVWLKCQRSSCPSQMRIRLSARAGEATTRASMMTDGE